MRYWGKVRFWYVVLASLIGVLFGYLIAIVVSILGVSTKISRFESLFSLDPLPWLLVSILVVLWCILKRDFVYVIEENLELIVLLVVFGCAVSFGFFYNGDRLVGLSLLLLVVFSSLLVPLLFYGIYFISHKIERILSKWRKYWLVFVEPLQSKIKKILLRKQNSRFFWDDNPISGEQEDCLSRDLFVDLLVRTIEFAPVDRGSFVIGLYGDWGIGKSSIINLAIEKIRKNKEMVNEFFVLKFDPWYFSDKESLLKALYTDIATVVGSPYLKGKLISLYEQEMSLKSSIIDFSFKKKPNFRDLRDGLERYFSDLPKKLVIFIDEIDRLDKNEILLIFKLVRLTLNFKNIVFVLSFSPMGVAKKLDLKDPYSYLGKIVNHVLWVPSLYKEEMESFWFAGMCYDLVFGVDKKVNRYVEFYEKDRRSRWWELLEKQIRNKKIFDNIKDGSVYSVVKEEILQDEFLKACMKFYREVFLPYRGLFFNTLRKIKRYIISLKVTILSLKGEVNYYDVMVLKLIELYYPSGYTKICQEPYLFIPYEWADDEDKVGQVNYMFNKDKSIDDLEMIYQDKRNRVNKIIRRESNHEVLLDLLKKIFVEVETAYDGSRKKNKEGYEKNRRVSSPKVFKRYFGLKVLPMDISYTWIRILIDKWNKLIKTDRQNFRSEVVHELKNVKTDEFIDGLMIFREELHPDVLDILSLELAKRAPEKLYAILKIMNSRMEEDKLARALVGMLQILPDVCSKIYLYDILRKAKDIGDPDSYKDLYKIRNLNDTFWKEIKNAFYDQIKFSISGKDDNFLKCLVSGNNYLAVICEFCSETRIKDDFIEFLLCKFEENPMWIERVLTLCSYSKIDNGTFEREVTVNISFLKRCFGKYMKKLCVLIKKYKEKISNISDEVIFQLCEEANEMDDN